MKFNTMKLNTIEDFTDFKVKCTQASGVTRKSVAVCCGTGCRAAKGLKVREAFSTELKNRGLDAEIEIKETGCHGLCELGPLVVIRPGNIFYHSVSPGQVPEIIEKTLLKEEIIETLLYRTDGQTIIKEEDIPFYKKQHRIISGKNSSTTARSIEDYIACGGYAALAKVLSGIKPEEVIGIIEKSGLRGRGGGGYPTGRKWRSCRNAKGARKFVICNADEGDPGAFMDCSILAGNPHSVLEGMIIGSYAIGAHEGYIYVRAEYPLALETISHAIAKAGEYGLLGAHILGSSHSFDIKISKGGGAFVCGESTALMLSIEGRRGEPRTKHIHTVESGLYDLPTNLNNVETWANVPVIINQGDEWYSKIGTEGSKGTKLFSLVGKVVNTGLVEVPMGISLKEIIFDIGGGIRGGKKFKAVQTGGPSGGCIPESMLHMPVDFDALTQAGSMMGSGGMIVMDEDTCMVDVARYFLHFLVEESCGKCTPCREGTYQLYQIIERITKGKGKPGDIDALTALSETIMDASLCALGKTAPHPVLSTLRYFRDEYMAHINEQSCPAGVCKALITYTIIPELCTACGKCLKSCPEQAITGEKKTAHRIITDKCVKCGICFSVCAFNAVKKVGNYAAVTGSKG